MTERRTLLDEMRAHARNLKPFKVSMMGCKPGLDALCQEHLEASQACDDCDDKRLCTTHLLPAIACMYEHDKPLDSAIATQRARDRSVLTEDDVRSIRADTRFAKDIAADYGLSRTAINDIKNRRSWKDV